MGIGIIFLSAVCTFAAFWLGLAVELMPGVQMPGLGLALALAVIVMGAFLMGAILFQAKGRSDK